MSQCNKDLLPLALQLQELAACGALTEVLREAGLRVMPDVGQPQAGFGLLGMFNEPVLQAQVQPIGAAPQHVKIIGPIACKGCAAAGKQLTEISNPGNLPHIGRIDE